MTDSSDMRAIMRIKHRSTQESRRKKVNKKRIHSALGTEAHDTEGRGGRGFKEKKKKSILVCQIGGGGGLEYNVLLE